MPGSRLPTASRPENENAQDIGELKERVDFLTGRVARIDSENEALRELRDEVRQLREQVGAAPTLDKEGTGLVGAVFELSGRSVGRSRRETMVTTGTAATLAAAVVGAILTVAQQLQAKPPVTVPIPIPVHAGPAAGPAAGP